jgi:hypothetical protein
MIKLIAIPFFCDGEDDVTVKGGTRQVLNKMPLGALRRRRLGDDVVNAQHAAVLRHDLDLAQRLERMRIQQPRAEQLRLSVGLTPLRQRHQHRHQRAPLVGELVLVARADLVIGVHPAYIDTDMVADVQAPKSTPQEVVALTLQALAEGREEVLVSDTSHGVKASLSTDSPVYLNH